MLLGSEILVAPVKNKCWTVPFCPYDRGVYLPAGRWVHLWSGKEYGSAEEGVYETVPAPIGEPAVFYKEGSEAGRHMTVELEERGLLERFSR